MASYVEQAILRVKDESSKPINKVRRELSELFATARRGRKISIEVTGVEKATRDVKALAAALRGLPRSKTVGFNLASGARSPVTQVRQLEGQLRKLQGQRVSVPVTMPGLTVAISRMRELVGLMNRANQRVVSPRVNPVREPGLGPRVPGRGAPFPGNVLAEANWQLAHLTINAARVTLSTAATAGLEGQAAETQREIIVNNDAIEAQLARIARQSVQATNRVSITRAEQIAQDSFVGGLRGDNLEALVPVIAQQESTAALLGGSAAATKALTTYANKVLNLANATEDLERSTDILSGIQAGAIVQGESFNAATSTAALRTAGFANTISGEGLVGFALATDALGQRAGSSLNRLRKELTTPLAQAGAGSGIAKGSVRNLIAGGIRGEAGITDEQAARFLRDPILFVQQDIRKALEDRGIDIEDRIAVSQEVGRSGFSVTSQRLITDALAAIAETERARALARNIADPEGVESAAADDLGAALKNLTAGFNSFSSEVLDPIFTRVAPSVNALAQFLENLALDDSATGQIRRLGVVAGVAATALAAIGALRFTSSRIMSIANAGPKLTTSAMQLQAAAAALQQAAGAQALGGAGTGRPGAAPAPTRAASAAQLASQTRGNMGRAGVGLGLGAFAIAGEVMAYVTNPEEFAAQQTAQIESNAASRRARETAAAEEGGFIRSLWRDLWSDAVAFKESSALASPALGEGGAGPTRLAQELLGVNDDLKLNFDTSAATFDTTFQTGTDQMLMTFGTGTAEMVAGLDGSAAAFGPTAGAGLLPFATEFGQIVGQGIREAVGTINVNANVQTDQTPAFGPRLATGESRPF